MKKLITLLSALTITSSIAPFTVACFGKSNQPFDIESITVNEIINFQNEYTIINEQNEEMTVKADQIGILKSSYMRTLLGFNLFSLLLWKVTRIDRTKLKEITESLNKYSFESLHLYENKNIEKLEEMIATKLKEIAENLNLNLDEVINAANKGKEKLTEMVETRSKEIGKNVNLDELLDLLEKYNEFNIVTQQNQKELLVKFSSNVLYNKSETEKILIFMSLVKSGSIEFDVKESENKQNNKKFTAIIEKRSLNQNYLENILDYLIKQLNLSYEIKLVSIKSMYDLIKGNSANIEIDLTNNQ